MAEIEENPFKLPPDDQIFAIREQERQRKLEEREKVKSQKVWEKMTSSCRISRTRRVEDGADETQIAAEAARKKRSGNNATMRPEGGTVGRDSRREKENVADFVAQKREMFLVQMSLDVKKAEILKLDARAKDKEEALNKSRQMLDEDVTRFDAFLGNNDKRAHRAMEQAEQMTKKKQERMSRIKQLKSELSNIQSQITNNMEKKAELLKYKDFLKNLTPPEWTAEKEQEKRDRKAARFRAQVNARMAEINAKMQEEIAAEERAAEEKEKENAKGRRRQKKGEDEEAKEREQMEARRRKIRRKYPTQEAVEAETVIYSSDEEIPLYFHEPKQLLDIFATLEESNLFLIQNSQDTETALDDLQQKFAEMRKARGAMTEKGNAQVKQIERQIADEKNTVEELKQTLSQKHGASEQERLLKELGNRVAEVHSVCSTEGEGDGDTLQMLKNVEAKLEEFLTYLDEAEESGMAHQVQALEHRKEIDRRMALRRQRKEQQDRKIEERLKSSLERSQAPVHKKVGKQIMFRSAPLFQTKKVIQEDDGYEQAVEEHNIFGIWVGKDGKPNAAEPVKQTQ
eukprot:TRINITY_DN2030_c0_g2_i1.p1 TRINITY_DN2030_c0_g2~~TRINITY_DN2030_c0_g2_i1.p1  ORF type:complete len:571 (-),score=174.04 TRINITY_DN2030_c0_g2_i1:78-1790(-)